MSQESVSAGTLARTWHALTAVAVVVAVGIALALGGSQAPDDVAAFPSLLARDANQSAYFTIQANVIVGITALLLALRPRRSALLFRVFRLDGVAMIALTAVVYQLLLAHVPPYPHGWAAVDNVLLHVVVPLMALAGWVIFGPRGLVSWKVAGLSLLYPVGWLVVTVIRGAVIDWYPYAFMDPREQGYAPVATTVAVIVVAFIVLAALLFGVDRALGRLRRRNDAAAPAKPY